MPRDRAVHERLGKGRLIALIMPVPPIAEEVDDHIFLELLAEFGGDAGDFNDRFGIIAVDMKDRRLDALRHIRRIRARPGGRRARRKSDLVIDDDMDRAAGAKPGKVR
jgi:hypothetical protein